MGELGGGGGRVGDFGGLDMVGEVGGELWGDGREREDVVLDSGDAE